MCFPTRCLYGLGADARNEAALRRIFEIKQRPADMPLLVLIGDSAQMAALAERIPPAARLLMERFWPGRLTIVLPALPTFPPSSPPEGQDRDPARGPPRDARARRGHRVPFDRDERQRLRAAAGAGRSATSTRASAQGVDLILDAGPLKGGVGSTVVDVTGETPVILREGEVASTRSSPSSRASADPPRAIPPPFLLVDIPPAFPYRIGHPFVVPEW